MQSLGENCSMTERRADEATRDVTDWLKCEYMLDKVGEDFDGIVTSVLGFGLFVELADIYVEGLVHITSLRNDYYHFDAAKHTLTGEHSRKVFQLGGKVRVRVARVDLDDKKIDFEMLDGEGESLPNDRPSRGGKKGAKKGANRSRKKSTDKPAETTAKKRVGKKKTAKKKAVAKTTGQTGEGSQGTVKKKRRRRRKPKSKTE
jgi:ribonuclease R